MKPNAIAIACALLALSGCSPIERAAAPISQGSNAPGETLANYLDRLRSMNEAGLVAEAARQRRLVARDPDDLARVRAALALSLAPHAEETEILALVEPVAASPKTPPDLRGVASFLQAMSSERRRLRESAATAGNKLREERHAREQEKQRADALQDRAAELQQKLDALSQLEKSLSNRPPGNR
jgi:hypothetical protein